MNITGDPLVLVVPLGAATPPWSTLSWKDMVYLKHVFFHPVGAYGYPKLPAEYLGFRHDAHLQAIAEIENVVTISCRSELGQFVPEVDGEACRLAYDGGRRVAHYLYKLKNVVKPVRLIPSGRVFQAAKVKAFLSSLQSCDSISDAVADTRERLAQSDSLPARRTSR